MIGSLSLLWFRSLLWAGQDRLRARRLRVDRRKMTCALWCPCGAGEDS